MKVQIKSITPEVENTIVEIARVSSSRKNKVESPEGLLSYLIKNKHYSPFEHGFITFEIETSKAIGIQLLRHRSFTFQEFSQRYQDVGKVSDNGMFEDIELRRQAESNRQSSTDVMDFEDEDTVKLSDAAYGAGSHIPVDQAITMILRQSEELYNGLLTLGVAREQARMFLPLCTKTKIYMTGSVRSWIHFLELRDDPHAQKEIQLIAKEIKSIFKEQLPIISNSLNY